MQILHLHKKQLLLASLALALVACASTETVSEDDEDWSVPEDPFESTNRVIYGFNSVVDGVVLEPLARGYDAITPQPVQGCISNIGGNLNEPVNTVGHTIGGELGYAGQSLFRFGFNTVFGIFGCFDAAAGLLDIEENETDIGLGLRAQFHTEDTEQLYLVLPIIGPSTPLDATGTIAGSFLDPLQIDSQNNPYWIEHNKKRAGVQVLTIIDYRAQLLPATDFIKEAALDPYEFTRDAYLEQRVATADEIRLR